VHQTRGDTASVQQLGLDSQTSSPAPQCGAHPGHHQICKEGMSPGCPWYNGVHLAKLLDGKFVVAGGAKLDEVDEVDVDALGLGVGSYSLPQALTCTLRSCSIRLDYSPHSQVLTGKVTVWSTVSRALTQHPIRSETRYGTHQCCSTLNCGPSRRPPLQQAEQSALPWVHGTNTAVALHTTARLIAQHV
jgi:hypothetical protein